MMTGMNILKKTIMQTDAMNAKVMGMTTTLTNKANWCVPVMNAGAIGVMKMTNKEKLDLIRKLCLNLSPIDFTDDKVGLGAGHALNVAIECILDMKGEGRTDDKETSDDYPGFC